MNYDSTSDTKAHIARVAQLLNEFAAEINRRGFVHDQSKLMDPEKALFDEYTPKLKDCTYGSDEYKGFLSALKPALDNHYAKNSHHPEHYPYHCPACYSQFTFEEYNAAPTTSADCEARYCPKCCAFGGIIYETDLMRKPNLGISGMDLFDVVEMFFDWKAASERMETGDIRKSIEFNRDRFLMDPQLVRIFNNTVDRMWPLASGTGREREALSASDRSPAKRDGEAGAPNPNK